MAYNYDKLYRETPDALGAPTPAFVDFFDALDVTGLRVLDVGCGQGRDAVFIAQLGHRVVGVDMSPAGIAALEGVANVTGIVADITTFKPDGMFDVLLIDRTLHMLGKKERHATLARLLKHLVPNGYLLIADEPSNMAGLKDVIAAANWHVIKDKDGYWFAQMLPTKLN